MRRAVFLDRDGTLIEDRGHLQDASDVVFFPDTVPALRRLQQTFDLFIVTHQPGVAQGILDPADVDAVHRHILDHLARADVRIREVYWCPHDRSAGCTCIKPSPYHLQVASRRFGIDLGRSFAVGDHPHDVEMARNAGATGIYVLTGHGAKHRSELRPDATVVPGIREAAELVMNLAGCGAGEPACGTPDSD